MMVTIALILLMILVLLLLLIHAKVRTVKISLTLLECQTTAGVETSGCLSCSAADNCGDCVVGHVRYVVSAGTDVRCVKTSGALISD